MKNGKLVAAQIGCGAFAKAQHLPNLKEREDVEVRYCCDIFLDAAKEAAARFGVPKAVADYGEALADPEVDFVMVATSHDMHLPIVRAAAARGKHIFCEKPMAMELPESWEIIRAVRRAGVKLCVDLNRRMAPSMHALKARVQAQIAAPKHQPWRYVETSRAPLPEEEATHFLIRIQDEGSSYRMVHMDPAHGGGAIIGESVHWMDLACWFFAPQVPVEITACGSSRMTHLIHLKFSGGDSATLDFSVGGTFDYPKELFEVTSRAALFRNLFFVENRYYGIPGLDAETFPLQRDDFAADCPGEGFDAFLAKTALQQRAAAGNLRNVQRELIVDKGHRAMLAGFLAAIRGNAAVPCDELAGLQATLLAKLAIQSIRSRQTLPVPIEELRPAIL